VSVAGRPPTPLWGLTGHIKAAPLDSERCRNALRAWAGRSVDLTQARRMIHSTHCVASSRRRRSNGDISLLDSGKKSCAAEAIFDLKKAMNYRFTVNN